MKSEKLIEKFRNASLEMRYKGLLAILSDYIENPDPKNRERVKLYIYNILEPKEFVEFVLDNITTLGRIEESIEEMKQSFDNNQEIINQK